MSLQTRPAVQPAVRRISMTPFERVMLLDQHPGYPMCFRLSVTVDDQLDATRLQRSVHEAQKRHPLLRARIDDSDNWHWRVQQNGSATVDVVDSRPPAEPIDLSVESAVRVAVVQRKQSELCFDFHHAATDATGAFQFLIDVLLAYSGETIERVSAEWFEEYRARLGTPKPEDSGVMKSFGRAMKTLFQRPTSLAKEKLKIPESRFDVLEHSFDVPQTKALVQSARAQSASVNDLLISKLLSTLHGWMDERGRKSSHLRILVPINYRSPELLSEPARNHVGYWFLTRNTSQLRDEGELLAGIGKEIQYARKTNQAAFFEGIFQRMARFPVVEPLIHRASSHMCLATAVLSNIGQLETGIFKPWVRANGRVVIGDTMIEDLELAPPVRPWTHAACLAFTFRNRLRLQLQADGQAITLPDATSLLAGYSQAILGAIESAVPLAAAG